MLDGRAHYIVRVPILGNLLHLLSFEKEFGYLLDCIVVKKTDPNTPFSAGDYNDFTFARLELRKRHSCG